MTNDRIDLRKLPAWLKYLVSLAVIAVVVGAAWLVGGDRPAPGWLTNRLIPALGWVYLALCVYVIIYYAARRLRKK
jgi:hypothetical protein